jgi:demethoxyubiquinone hydroxylase (CLK1/Coq7/Cat5 family)
MERFATAIYRIQRGGFEETMITEKLTYAIDNERQHALNLRNRIIELNNTPSRFAFLFQIVGSLMGCLSRCFGRMFPLKIDVVIEKRAVKDYGYFLKTSELDDKTKLLIKSIIADEELHIKNWQDSIEILNSKT